MNIQEYISSGVVQSYVLGLASEDERKELEAFTRDYPALEHAVNSFMICLEQHAMCSTPAIDRLHSIAHNPALLDKLDSREFEKLVAAILREQGYTVTLTPATRDGGKDITVAHHTSFGQFIYFVECKRYSSGHKIGVDMIRQLEGVIEHYKVTAGILVTNSYFTRDALQWQKDIEHRIKLVDHTILLQWLADYRRKYFN